MLKVGVIGTGLMGSGHARNIDKFVLDASVVALSDLNTVSMQALSEELGTVKSTYQNPEDLINDDEVDAIVIASPDSLHPAHIRMVLGSGKQALCEKPLAVNLEEAKTIASEISSVETELGRRLISFGFQRRFDPAYKEVRRLLRSGNFGNALFVRAITRNVKSTDITTPQMYSNIAIHDFDIYRWLFESNWVDVQTHSCRSSSLTQPGLKDPLLFSAYLDNGIVLMADIVAFNNYGYDARFEVVCERGSIEVGIFGDVIQRVDFKADSAQGGNLAQNWMVRSRDAYIQEVIAWSNQVTSGVINQDLASVADALAANVASEMGIQSL